MKQHKNGFGREIPPASAHVIAWFIQKGSAESVALSFFRHYGSLKWRNRKGEPIRDWKVHAWNWLWNRVDQAAIKPPTLSGK